jgi:antitoxin (DNA-binding transcriptional repressor) of toxin-antitoxin stability system
MSRRGDCWDQRRRRNCLLDARIRDGPRCRLAHRGRCTARVAPIHRRRLQRKEAALTQRVPEPERSRSRLAPRKLAA